MYKISKKPFQGLPMHRSRVRHISTQARHNISNIRPSIDHQIHSRTYSISIWHLFHSNNISIRLGTQIFTQQKMSSQGHRSNLSSRHVKLLQDLKPIQGEFRKRNMSMRSPVFDLGEDSAIDAIDQYYEGGERSHVQGTGARKKKRKKKKNRKLKATIATIGETATGEAGSCRGIPSWHLHPTWRDVLLHAKHVQHLGQLLGGASTSQRLQSIRLGSVRRLAGGGAKLLGSSKARGCATTSINYRAPKDGCRGPSGEPNHEWRHRLSYWRL